MGAERTAGLEARLQRTEAELQRAREELAELQRVAHIGTWSWDVVRDRVEWSPEMHRISGVGGDAPVTASSYAALYHPEDRERVQRQVQAALRDGQPYVVEYRIIRPDGEHRWIEGRGVGMRNEAGAVVRLFGTAQDVTEKKQAELRAAELATEQAARQEAEASAQRLAFIAEASALLASSLDYETTLQNVARLAVPGIADWCAVDLSVQGGSTRRVAVQHTDPAKLQLVREIEEEYPPDPTRSRGAAHVIRTGRAELIEEIPDELLTEAAVDARHLELIRALGLRSYLVVPLIARGRTLGAFTMVQAESGRLFRREDLGFVEDLARRAAIAIDNAQLVQDLEHVQHQLEEQSAELEVQASELSQQAARLEEQAVQQSELLQTLERERGRLSAIIEQAPIGFLFAEAPSGRIVMGNPAAERILRHPILYSESIDEYAEWVAYHEDGRRVDAHEYPLARALRTGRAAGPDEYHYHRGDGTRAWIRLTAAPVWGSDGEMVAALVIIDDITNERRSLEEREQLLQQVSAERHRLAEIFENAPAVMALFSGPDLTIQLVNPQWERMVGKADVVGRTARDVFPEFEGSGLLERLDAAYATGQSYTEPELRVPLRRREGGAVEETYWNLVWLPLAPRADGTRDILVHAVELTQQVRARRQVHGLTQAALAVHSAGTLPDALRLITEHARSIIGAHQAITSMTVNSDWAQSISSVSLSDRYAAWRDYSVPPTGEGIYTLICETNQPLRLTQEELVRHPRWSGFSREAHRHPPMRGWLAAPLIARDGGNLGLIQLSDREHGEFTEDDEAVLMQLAQMASVAIENAQLYERALEASRAKSDFLTTMSHELRTPLNAMIGYSELLEMGVPEPIPDASRKQVERINLAAQHLLQLIEEILTFSRVEAGRENIITDSVSVAGLTREVRAIIEPLAARRDLAFVVDIPEGDIELQTDPRKLRQILLNLLGNAIKFTQRGSVTFRARPDDSAITFEVQDTGIGMDAEQLKRIYEPFWQAETAIHARSSGTGLGLPVSRQLVELLGGSIAVSSTPDVGTTFTVRLPRSLEPQ